MFSKFSWLYVSLLLTLVVGQKGVSSAIKCYKTLPGQAPIEDAVECVAGTPPYISMAWAKNSPPQDVFFNEEFVLYFYAKINTIQAPINGSLITHANVHACRTQPAIDCVPFVNVSDASVSNQQLFLTHDVAQTNVPISGDTLGNRFNFTMLLDSGAWTLMAHVRYTRALIAGGGVIDAFISINVLTKGQDDNSVRDVLIIVLASLLIMVLALGLLYKWRLSRQDDSNSSNRVFLTEALKRKLNQEFFVLTGFTILELVDVISDASAYARVLGLNERDQFGIVVPYSIVIVGSFSISFILFLVRINMFRQLYQRRMGIMRSTSSEGKQDLVLDLSSPHVQLAKVKRDILHTWVSLLLALMEDAPLLTMNGYLLWKLDKFTDLEQPILIGVVFGLMALGVRLSLFIEVSMLYEKKQGLLFQMQEGGQKKINEMKPVSGAGSVFSTNNNGMQQQWR